MNTFVTNEQSLELADYYDAMPYQSYAFAQTAPEHLQAVGRLFGLSPKTAAKARVLELGCASGGNLLPFAARNPQAEAVGVDLSSVHIQQANATLKRMELENIRFQQCDLSTLDADIGTFDYIICHGVYSWVPDHVQQAIHRIANQCLAKDGIAYISYNTYPGWKAREIVRDAMQFRGGERPPLERLRFARGMVEFMHKMAKPQSALKVALDEIKPLIDNGAPSYLLHDYLEPFNSPVYFGEFVLEAESHDLAYLAEASVSSMFVSNYGAEIAEPLLKECADSQVTLEQYLDFLTNRPFRQTLLVHAEKHSSIRYRLEAERLEEFSYAGFFEKQNDKRQPGDPDNRLYYETLAGSLHITGIAGQTIASILNEAWPSTVSFDAILSQMVAKTRLDKRSCRNALQAFVEEGIIKAWLRFRVSPVSCATKVAEKPETIIALRKVLKDVTVNPAISVWNDWHEPVNLTGFQALIARRLDGTRKITDLLRDLNAMMTSKSSSPSGSLSQTIFRSDMVSRYAIVSPETWKDMRRVQIARRLSRTPRIEGNGSTGSKGRKTQKSFLIASFMAQGRLRIFGRFRAIQ